MQKLMQEESVTQNRFLKHLRYLAEVDALDYNKNTSIAMCCVKNLVRCK